MDARSSVCEHDDRIERPHAGSQPSALHRPSRATPTFCVDAIR
jgi:hypothetical protein